MKYQRRVGTALSALVISACTTGAQTAGSEGDSQVYSQALRTLEATDTGNMAIVRRYREKPSPLVRDSVRDWRTGRLDRILDGDFDVVS